MAGRAKEYRTRLDHDPVAHGLGVLLANLIGLLVVFAAFPPHTHDETFEEAAERFGYEGPTQYVREIRVRLTNEGVGSVSAHRLLGSVERRPDRPLGEEGTPVPPRVRRGGGQGGRSEFPGTADESSVGSLRGRRLNLPTVQSEQLIIVDLVKPEYPEVAIRQGLEGRVELLALVDTRGRVEDIEIVKSGGPLLDEAAAKAVRRCRFLPYRVNGQVQAVYANFRFNFTLLDRTGQPE